MDSFEQINRDVAIIYNSRSGAGAGNRREMLLEAARASGWRGKLLVSHTRQNVSELVEETAKNDKKRIVLAGGDGTIQAGLGEILKNRLTLALIPLGTGNVVAKNLGIPFSISKATQTAFEGKKIAVDVGVANSRFFLLSTSLGITADTMMLTKRSLKKRFGVLAYGLSVLRLLGKRSRVYQIFIDESKVYQGRAKGIWVLNFEKFAGVAMAPGAHSASGDFRVGILHTNTVGEWLDFLWYLVRGKPYESKHYDVLPGKKIDIQVVGRAVRYECDGTEYERVKTLKVRLHSQKLQVVVPESRVKNVVLWDYDGTLADSLGVVLEVYNTLAHKYRLPRLDSDRLLQLRGMAIVEIMRMFPLGSLRLKKLTSQFRMEFRHEGKQIELFDGVPELLKTLAKDFEMGIVTSNESAHVNQILDRHGLEMFKFVVSEPKIFGKANAIKKLIHANNYDSQRVVYIGDEVRDIEAAKSVGIKVIAVTWGFNTRSVLEKANPDWLVDQVKQIDKRLKEWFFENKKLST